MTAHEARSESVVRPGWVTRTYPLVLDRWQALTDMARVTAKILCTECRIGDVFSVRFADWIVHHFARPKRDEKAVRDAFALLVDLGVLHIVGAKRGRHGWTLYQLRDPITASQRMLGLAADDPQQRFEFAREPRDEEFDDRGGGLRVLRLFNPTPTSDSTFNPTPESDSFPRTRRVLGLPITLVFRRPLATIRTTLARPTRRAVA